MIRLRKRARLCNTCTFNHELARLGLETLPCFVDWQAASLALYIYVALQGSIYTAESSNCKISILEHLKLPSQNRCFGVQETDTRHIYLCMRYTGFLL